MSAVVVALYAAGVWFLMLAAVAAAYQGYVAWWNRKVAARAHALAPRKPRKQYRRAHARRPDGRYMAVVESA